MALITQGRNGQRLLSHPRDFAHKHFSGGATVQQLPKSRNIFFAVIVPNETMMKRVIASPYNSTTQIFSVETAEIPKMDFQVETLNEYNRKRLAYKKVQYQPVTTTFFDTSYGDLNFFLKAYNNYYFGDSNDSNANIMTWMRDSARGTMNHVYNFGVQTIDQPLIDRITIFRLHGQKLVTSWTLFNPLISSVVYDTLDYSNSDVAKIAVTFDYEGYVMSNVSADIRQVKGLDTTELFKALEYIDGIADVYDLPTNVPNDGGPGFNLGDIIRTGTELYARYNGKPNVKDVLKEYFLNPIIGNVTNTLSSYGNFEFGQGVGLTDVVNKINGTIAAPINQAAKGVVDGAGRILKSATAPFASIFK